MCHIPVLLAVLNQTGNPVLWRLAFSSLLMQRKFNSSQENDLLQWCLCFLFFCFTRKWCHLHKNKNKEKRKKNNNNNKKRSSLLSNNVQGFLCYTVFQFLFLTQKLIITRNETKLSSLGQQLCGCAFWHHSFVCRGCFTSTSIPTLSKYRCFTVLHDVANDMQVFQESPWIKAHNSFLWEYYSLFQISRWCICVKTGMQPSNDITTSLHVTLKLTLNWNSYSS